MPSRLTRRGTSPSTIFSGREIVSFVAEADGRVVAMYKLIPNRRDRGSHVANASFMVDPAHGGRGIGWALGRHCLAEAWARGYLSMQFNFVVSTNTRAVALWQRLGFTIVGTLPRAFRHRDLGDVDALVMYRSLDDPSRRRRHRHSAVRRTAWKAIRTSCARARLRSWRTKPARSRRSERRTACSCLVAESIRANRRHRPRFAETREECAVEARLSGEVGRAADVVWSNKESTCFEKRCVFFAATLAARLDRTAEHEVLWLQPADAAQQITRAGHAWAVRQWLATS